MPEKLPPEALTPEEVDRILRATSRKTATGIRARAMLAVCYGGALRGAELLKLKPADVIRSTGEVRIRADVGKRGRAGRVFVPEAALVLLDLWLQARETWPITPEATLFCTHSGGTVDTGYLRRLLPRLARRAGLSKRVHVHALRHGRLSGLARSGTPLAVVQAAARHSSLSTTLRYLEHIAPFELEHAMRRELGASS